MSDIVGGRRPLAGVEAVRGRTSIAIVVLVLVLAACGGGGGDDSAATTIDPTLEKGTPAAVLCKEDTSDPVTLPDDVQALVEDLDAAAGFESVQTYADYRVVCDNTGVTHLEAPTEYAAVEPSPAGPPQTAVRVGTDLSGRVEDGPVLNFFAAPVGGTQYPTRPPLGTTITQSADGSLSSGTREPREGNSITEDCRPQPFRDFATGTFTGTARLYVDCGEGGRAWLLVAADPDDGAPYFVQFVAQVQSAADVDAVGRALATMSVDADALAAFAERQEEGAAAAAPTATTTAPPTTATP